MVSPVDETNIEQARAWDGDEGAYWAARHEAFEESLDRYQPAFLGAADIAPTDHVLDVGCGTGVSTRAAARAAHEGRALGIDLSSQMIDVARRLAEREGLANATFEVGDAQVHPFAPASHDVVVSRTGAMFFGRPDVAFAHLRRSLVPGGRLVLLTWQGLQRQEWLSSFARALAGRTPPEPGPDAPGPFSLSDPDHTRALLTEAGFADVEIVPVEESTTYGRTVAEAHDLLLGMLGWMLDGRGPAEREAAVEALRADLLAHEGPDGVRYQSAAWLVTAGHPR